MPVDSEFVRHVLELLEDFGETRGRRMFGGYGLFRDDLMFALIADDELYFKVDEYNRDAYESRGLAAFTYVSRGQTRTLGYYRAPEEALDEPAETLAWAGPAFDAALRAAAGKRKKSTQRRGKRR